MGRVGAAECLGTEGGERGQPYACQPGAVTVPDGCVPDPTERTERVATAMLLRDSDLAGGALITGPLVGGGKLVIQLRCESAWVPCQPFQPPICLYVAVLETFIDEAAEAKNGRPAFLGVVEPPHLGVCEVHVPIGTLLGQQDQSSIACCLEAEGRPGLGWPAWRRSSPGTYRCGHWRAGLRPEQQSPSRSPGSHQW